MIVLLLFSLNFLGKVFTPKKEEKKVEENGQKVDIGEEWETALEDATEEDLVQLAGV